MWIVAGGSGIALPGSSARALCVAGQWATLTPTCLARGPILGAAIRPCLLKCGAGRPGRAANRYVGLRASLRPALGVTRGDRVAGCCTWRRLSCTVSRRWLARQRPSIRAGVGVRRAGTAGPTRPSCVGSAPATLSRILPNGPKTVRDVCSMCVVCVAHPTAPVAIWESNEYCTNYRLVGETRNAGKIRWA